MSLRKDWLSRQFVRVDADVRNWPESMKVEAGFATRDRVGEMSCALRRSPKLTQPYSPKVTQAFWADPSRRVMTTMDHHNAEGSEEAM